MDESTYICKLKKRSTIIWPFNIIKRRHENLCWIDPHFCPHNTPWIDPNFWGVLLSNSQNFEEHNGGRTRKATRNEIWKIRRCCSLETVLLEMENNLHWSITQDLSSPTAYPLKLRPFSFFSIFQRSNPRPFSCFLHSSTSAFPTSQWTTKQAVHCDSLNVWKPKWNGLSLHRICS